MQDLDVESEGFKWESEEQRKGFFNLIQFLKEKHPQNVHQLIASVAAYFIQKDHESHEYWVELVGNQIGQVNKQLRLLQEDVNYLTKKLEEVNAIAAQTLTVTKVAGLVMSGMKPIPKDAAQSETEKKS